MRRRASSDSSRSSRSLRAASSRSRSARARWWCCKLERGGERRVYHAVVVPEENARLDELMAETYGLADWLIVSLRSEGPSTPVRLDPVAP